MRIIIRSNRNFHSLWRPIFNGKILVIAGVTRLSGGNRSDSDGVNVSTEREATTTGRVPVYGREKAVYGLSN